MARNFVQPGNTLTIPAPATVSGGGVVIAGGIIGIAAGDAAIGAPVDVETGGVWDLPKVSADAFTLGATVYWDAGDSLATVTATDNTKIGVAVAAAGNGVATVKVRLSGF
jgi:predicted RecA/RadA family phage recombinase